MPVFWYYLAVQNFKQDFFNSWSYFCSFYTENLPVIGRVISAISDDVGVFIFKGQVVQKLDIDPWRRRHGDHLKSRKPAHLTTQRHFQEAVKP
jgi:hypothetical protein